MRRRDFITLFGGAVAGWPLAVRAQQSPMPVIGLLGSTSPGPYAPLVAAIRQGLKETGYVEGQNLAIEYRWAENQTDQLPALAAELVAHKVAVIVTSGSVPPALAAKAATLFIPIVFHMGADPVATGLVASLNRPGGNITGVSFLSVASAPKRLGLLRDVVPEAKVIGLLVNPANPTAEIVTNDLEAAVRSLGLTLHVVRASNDHELDDAFATLVQRRVGALIMNPDPYFQTRREPIVALAARHAIPAMYPGREFTEVGGLMGYGASLTDSYRQQGVYAGKILKGEKPADLPVMQSTKFDFVINLKTAKTLGLEVPAKLLFTADDVLE